MPLQGMRAGKYTAMKERKDDLPTPYSKVTVQGMVPRELRNLTY